MDEVEDKSHRNSKCFKSQDKIELGAPETHTRTHTEMYFYKVRKHTQHRSPNAM